MLDNDLSPSSGPQWYDLHVHDSSSNHSLPIPSPPPPSMSHQQNPLSLAPPHSTARQKSAPAYDTSATAAHTSCEKQPCPSLSSFLGVRKMFDYLCNRDVFSPDLSMKVSNFSKTVHTMTIKSFTVFMHPKVLLRAKWHQNRIKKH